MRHTWWLASLAALGAEERAALLLGGTVDDTDTISSAAAAVAVCAGRTFDPSAPAATIAQNLYTDLQGLLAEASGYPFCDDVQRFFARVVNTPPPVNTLPATVIRLLDVVTAGRLIATQRGDTTRRSTAGVAFSAASRAAAEGRTPASAPIPALAAPSPMPSLLDCKVLGCLISKSSQESQLHSRNTMNSLMIPAPLRVNRRLKLHLKG